MKFKLSLLIRNIKFSLLNLYPPFLFSGIRVSKISPDYRQVEVRLKLHFWNKNVVGTHFGGALYSMTDPFFMMMYMRNLGNSYMVWDQSARINFIKPGRGVVVAKFILTQEMIDLARQSTENGAKYQPVHQINVIDEQGEVVSNIEKTIYIRQKKTFK
jgi:acyl-coenzyme A thioesterase PaaI-like protein